MELPISDYVTDTKSVLDQSIRVLQAMVDVAANGGWLQTALSTMHLLQMIMQVHENLCLYGYWVPAMDTFVFQSSLIFQLHVDHFQFDSICAFLPSLEFQT
jgi:activating signal cointegrator complex subunit 3